MSDRPSTIPTGHGCIIPFARIPTRTANKICCDCETPFTVTGKPGTLAIARRCPACRKIAQKRFKREWAQRNKEQQNG